jgi:DNA-binding transcriptional LysR family regulator
MAFELQQLRQVIALAEHGSFVRAAAHLHISQPALSRSIQNLERQFGNELFLRSSGGVVPTDLGRLYIERARDLLRMADELAGEAVRHAGLRTGRVDVGGGPYPAESFLGPAVARFVEQFPRVGVHLHSGNWDDLVQLLLKHWTAMAPLVVEEDGDMYEDIRSSGDDHLAHAQSYSLLGIDKLTRGGFFRFDFI